MRRSIALGALVVVVGLIAVGCGGDDDDSASTSRTASEAGAACEPVGDGSGTKVSVTLDEWAVVPSPSAVPADRVTFAVENKGDEPHELVVVKAASPEELSVVDGKVDEGALPAGAFIGEVEAFPAGGTCEGTFELAAGHYVLFCNLVEKHEGESESHFQQGMVATFEVS